MCKMCSELAMEIKREKNLNGEPHRCDIRTPDDLYGPAIVACLEEEDGTLWVSNDEYMSQVNYCPMCGYKARTQVNNEA